MLKKSIRLRIVAAVAVLFMFLCFAGSALADGRLAEETTVGPYGTSRVVYSYNREGRLSRKARYEDGSLESSTEYFYAPDGSLLEELWKGAVNLYWHYDSQGTVIERDETGGIGSPAYSLPYMGDSVRTEYNADGRITRFERQSGEGGQPYVLTYEYDSKGRILRFCAGDARTDSFDYRPDGSFTRSSGNRDMNLFITEYYNADGLCTQRDRKQDNWFSSTFLEYDSRGSLIRESVSPDGFERSWTYDAHGNPLEEFFDGSLVSRYRNSYDQDGNLIETVRSSGSADETTTYRYE